jgi:uncharacterized protein YkwD
MAQLRSPRGASSAGLLPRLAIAALVVGVVAGPAGSGAAERRAPGVLANGVFTPGRAAAKQYGADPEQTCPVRGAFDLLETELEATFKRMNRPVPTPEGRLCAAADTLLGWDTGESPPESLRRAVAWHFGLPNALGRVVIATIETEDPRIIAERVVEPAASFAAGMSAPRYGIALQRLRKNATRVALVMQDATVDLEPTPRQVAAEGKVTVAGKLLGGYVNPRVLACDPAGKLETPPAQEGKAFQVELRCGDRPGRMAVEIRGERDGKLASLAKFPVACGAEMPAGIAVVRADKGPVDPAAAARKIFDRMNAERSAVGIPALAWDDAVAGVARDAAGHLRTTATGGTAAPFDLVAALKKVDVASPLVLQNPVAATSADEVAALVEMSPVDRSNVLDRQATHAGVGVVPDASKAEGPRLLFAAQLLVKELPPVDPAAVKKQLAEAIARKRADARAAPVSDDSLLDEIAQAYAAELATGRGEIPKARESAIVAPLYQRFRTVNILAGVKTDPLEFAEEPGVVGQAKAIGIGVAQGTSPTLGKNSVFVVVVTGTRR